MLAVQQNEHGGTKVRNHSGWSQNVQPERQRNLASKGRSD